jgi:hypothetical protein
MQRPHRLGPGRHPSVRYRRRLIAMLTSEGPEYLIVADPSIRSWIARHWNAVRRYVETGDTRRLRVFRGRTVTLSDGSRLEFATDLATIDQLAEGGELHYELYRR